MSTSSRMSRSYNPNRQLGSVQSVQEGTRRSRAASRARLLNVSYNDAYSFALRIAFLHYILQPRKKRKEYIPTPAAQKPPQRIQTTMGLMKDFLPTGNSHSVKLPSGFRAVLEKRMSGVMMGTEKLGGFKDRLLVQSFAEAFTAFTARDFQRQIDKDRKIEPLILMFYSSATKAQRHGKAPDDDSYKLLVDRHVAMFVRLLVSALKDQGAERDRPELVSRLANMEKKLLRNDQDLTMDAGKGPENQYHEVEIPLSYEVKDMHMVQVVAKIFGLTNSQVQADIDSNTSFWTEEAALRDYKAYQFRLSANMAGTLARSDFDLDDAFDEWKKGEAPHLGQIIAEILTVRPELRAHLSGDKALPIRPQSLYGDDQAYAELGRMLSSDSGIDPSPSLGSLSLDDTTSIRSVDDPNYTFIPPDPRAYYKTILQYAVSYDQLHSDADEQRPPLSETSLELLNELAVRWRVPQFSRLVTFVEVTTKKFLDQEIDPMMLVACLDYVKEPQPESKKAPLIQLYAHSLPEIDPNRWTIQDFAGYRQALKDLHDALLRELYEIMMKCYEPKPPSAGVVMAVLTEHIYNDAAFSQRPQESAEFSQHLENGLRQAAAQVYRGYLDQNIPRSQEEWNFAHVVKLGKAVVGTCERIKKRYRAHPEILGVSPFKVLVETMFPSFEGDAHEFIKRVLQVAKEHEIELNLQDGFDLYKELVEIRKIHVASLPGKPFAFHIESLLEDFAWRWLKNAEQRVVDFLEEAIKQDQFEVRSQDPDTLPTDDERHSVSIIDSFTLFNQMVDQVFKLEWDDDVHHARFMTALSKAFAVGIGRYCEIVEQKFMKEMDRQTDQELAAAQKTTQEKFLQYAKDAWSKEKVEPFQFYPESFVKLNNIEYAIQQLDRLSKLMNVDECAEILRRADGPKQLARKPQKYTFTIKIVEAEGLKACDPNGTSDPYVVLNDERQNRLAKTRIIYRNLNPRWDETVDFTVSGAVNVIATIWDWDTFGDHDFVGRTSLKLDPIHFGDYLPREFWLDLDTQGRLLLRVSMEGERDDIQFYFGKAFRYLKKSERDMVRKVTEKLTAHINASLSHEALRSLMSRGLAASVASLFKKRQSTMPTLTEADIENALEPLIDYFNENFAIMKQTLTEATMTAVMTRLWKEVLIAIEKLLVPPLSEKLSTQKQLTTAEMDVVFKWLQILFDFFLQKGDDGVVYGIPAEVLKSPKWHELASLNFFYFETTENLIKTSERMAAANAQRAQQQLQQANSPAQNRLSAPPTFGATFNGAAAFGSLGTIRRGKSIIMSRNLGTMRQAKEEKRKEAQADPSDDMILRILRMRPEAAGYLKERHRQKERMAAAQAAAMIVQQSVHQGWNGPAFGGALYGRNNLPKR